MKKKASDVFTSRGVTEFLQLMKLTVCAGGFLDCRWSAAIGIIEGSTPTAENMNLQILKHKRIDKFR